MRKDSFGETSLHDSGSLESLSQTTGSNLTARLSEDTAVKCELEITNRYSTPAYPQGNEQAETSNKVIVNGLKKRLDDAKGRWVEELPHVLWAYRTTLRWLMGETPFAMTYGAEAVIPLEANFPTPRTNSFNPSGNDELLGESLDLI